MLQPDNRSVDLNSVLNDYIWLKDTHQWAAMILSGCMYVTTYAMCITNFGGSREYLKVAQLQLLDHCMKLWAQK